MMFGFIGGWMNVKHIPCRLTLAHIGIEMMNKIRHMSHIHIHKILDMFIMIVI
jgi:hypothetical protein